MPARTDHDRRDAQHAARGTITLFMARYIRRMTEESYAHIEEVATKYDGDAIVDWSEVGRAAAIEALASYGVSTAPVEAIETSEALPPGAT